MKRTLFVTSEWGRPVHGENDRGEGCATRGSDTAVGEKGSAQNRWPEASPSNTCPVVSTWIEQHLTPNWTGTVRWIALCTQRSSDPVYIFYIWPFICWLMTAQKGQIRARERTQLSSKLQVGDTHLTWDLATSGSLFTQMIPLSHRQRLFSTTVGSLLCTIMGSWFTHENLLLT